MSAFKTIDQLNVEKTISRMFKGLDDDIALKTVIEVMYGLKPESVLDELKAVNEVNEKIILKKMELEEVPIETEGKLIHADNIE